MTPRLVLIGEGELDDIGIQFFFRYHDDNPDCISLFRRANQLGDNEIYPD